MGKSLPQTSEDNVQQPYSDLNAICQSVNKIFYNQNVFLSVHFFKANISINIQKFRQISSFCKSINGSETK